MPPDLPQPGLIARAEELLLRETHHRCANDLQLVVSLIALRSRTAISDEAREALTDVMTRVAILARARAEMNRARAPTLEAALRQMCEALQPLAEPRGIVISFTAEPVIGVSAVQVTTLALVVNELVTNAIKHAFAERATGQVSIEVARHGNGVIVTVDDDGLPVPTDPAPGGGGLGLVLVRRLIASIDGLLIAPAGPSKRFELRVPAGG